MNPMATPMWFCYLARDYIVSFCVYKGLALFVKQVFRVTTVQ